MGKIPRHLFVEKALLGEAYNDHPLPIGHKQTISQPYIVALMTDLLDLQGDEIVLSGHGGPVFIYIGHGMGRIGTEQQQCLDFSLP